MSARGWFCSRTPSNLKPFHIENCYGPWVPYSCNVSQLPERLFHSGTNGDGPSILELVFPVQAVTSPLKSVFQCGQDRVRMVGRLIYAKEQVARRRCVPHNEIGIERARDPYWIGSVGCQDRSGASGHSIRNRRSIGNRADASHVLGHGRGLIVLVIPLLIVILNLRRKSFGQLVTKDDDNLVIAVDCLRVVRRRIGAVQSKLVWTGGDGGITKRPRENVAFARGKRIVSREVGLFAEIRVYSHGVNIHGFAGYAFPVIVSGIASRPGENGDRSANWVPIRRNHTLVVIIPRVFGKKSHLCPERVVRIEAIVVRNIL